MATNNIISNTTDTTTALLPIPYNPDNYYWRNMRIHGVNDKVYAAICAPLNSIAKAFWLDDTLYYVDDNDNAKPISNFLPIPVEDIIVDDGHDQQRYISVIAQKSKDFVVTELQKTTIKMSKLDSMDWVGDAWGIDAHIYAKKSSNKERLRDIMMKIGQDTATKRTIYTHTGWCHHDGRLCYRMPGRVIGADDVEVQLCSNLRDYHFPSTVDNNDERNNALRTIFNLTDRRVIIPILALVFLSPLNAFMRQIGHEPLLVMCLIGKTQSRKSTIAAIALSFFGSFTDASLPAHFKDTDNAVEVKGSVLNDTLFAVDDLHPTSDPELRRNMKKVMQTVSRMYGDRCARDRLTPTIDLRPGNIPHGNVIVTVEDIADIGQSGLARNFIIDIPPDSIPIGDTLNKAQAYAADGTLGATMCDYIAQLLPQADNLPERLKDKFAFYRDKARDAKISGLGRTGDIVAWLMIGLDMLNDYLSYCGITDIDLTDSWDILKEIAKAQINMSDNVTPTQMLLEAASQLLTMGKIHTKYIGLVPQIDPVKGKFVGYSDDDNYYFMPAMIYAEVCRYYSSQKITYPISCQRLMQQLADYKISITNDGRTSFQKRIGSTRNRYLCIPRQYIDDLSDDQDDSDVT